jgi:hypothetical protein
VIFQVECETWSLALREKNRIKVFENRVLRRIFGPKKNEMLGGWRRLHNEELHKLYSSPSIIRMIKSNRMKWARHVARMRIGMHLGFWWKSQNEKNYYEDLNVVGKILLKRILKNGMEWHGLDSSGSGEGSLASSCEHDNETSGSKKW